MKQAEISHLRRQVHHLKAREERIRHRIDDGTYCGPLDILWAAEADRAQAETRLNKLLDR